MTRLRTFIGLVLALATRLAGQGGDETAQQLRRAQGLYDHLQIEQALPLLRQLISSEWPFPATAAERAEAYKYLGASLLLVGKNDSSVVYFRAALERDPFTDLDPDEFTPPQLREFAAARRLTFAVGVRPVTPARVDPRSERVHFTLVATHAAAIRASLRRADTAATIPVFNGDIEGVRDVAWDGLTPAGTLAPPGRYELVIEGRSALGLGADSARVFVDLRQEVEPLEDTLPDLTAAELLPERRDRSIATGDLAKGLAIAATVLGIAHGLSSDDLGRDATAPTLVAGTATITGLVAFIHIRRHPEIPANVGANGERRERRRAANEAIKARNAAKIAATLLVVSPAAGVGP